jgi:hypothetical protein
MYFTRGYWIVCNEDCVSIDLQSGLYSVLKQYGQSPPIAITWPLVLLYEDSMIFFAPPGFVWHDKLYCFTTSYFYYHLVTHEETIFQVSAKINGQIVPDFRFENKATKMVVHNDRIFGITTLYHGAFAQLFEFDPIDKSITFYDILNGHILVLGSGFVLHSYPKCDRLVIFGGTTDHNADVFFINMGFLSKFVTRIWQQFNGVGSDVSFRFE